MKRNVLLARKSTFSFKYLSSSLKRYCLFESTEWTYRVKCKYLDSIDILSRNIKFESRVIKPYVSISFLTGSLKYNSMKKLRKRNSSRMRYRLTGILVRWYFHRGFLRISSRHRRIVWLFSFAKRSQDDGSTYATGKQAHARLQIESTRRAAWLEINDVGATTDFPGSLTNYEQRHSLHIYFDGNFPIF